MLHRLLKLLGFHFAPNNAPCSDQIKQKRILLSSRCELAITLQTAEQPSIFLLQWKKVRHDTSAMVACSPLCLTLTNPTALSICESATQVKTCLFLHGANQPFFARKFVPGDIHSTHICQRWLTKTEQGRDALQYSFVAPLFHYKG